MSHGLCPRCYAPSREGAEFCHQCGGALRDSDESLAPEQVERKRALGPFILIVGAVFFVGILYLIGVLILDPERDYSLLPILLILLPLLAAYSLIMLMGIVFQVRPELPFWKAAGGVMRHPWLIPGLMLSNLSLVLGSIVGFVGGLTALGGALLLFELLPLGLVQNLISGEDRSGWVIQGAAQEFVEGGPRSWGLALVMLVGGVLVGTLGMKMAKAKGREDT